MPRSSRTSREKHPLIGAELSRGLKAIAHHDHFV
jgi:hypothetical protein